MKEAGSKMASRSFNVLKKNYKGPLTEYQRSFCFWKIFSPKGQILGTTRKILNSSITGNR